MSSENSRPFTAYVMESLYYVRNLRRNRNYAEALLELYELIPDLDPEIQIKLKPYEDKIEAIWKKVNRSVGQGSEYGIAIEITQSMQRESEAVLREIRRCIGQELHKAGYFDFEKKGYSFYDLSKGKKSE